MLEHKEDALVEMVKTESVLKVVKEVSVHAAVNEDGDINDSYNKITLHVFGIR